jgi:hypothetical protein
MTLASGVSWLDHFFAHRFAAWAWVKDDGPRGQVLSSFSHWGKARPYSFDRAR